MLAKGLRTHSLYDYGGYILSYIKIVYKHRNIPVQVKNDFRLLIKAAVFIEHLIVKEILLHGLYNTWIHSHFYIGQAQSIHYAVMQLMTAVGHRHVCPMPTNTRLVNPPIERNVGYLIGPVTK